MPKDFGSPDCGMTDQRALLRQPRAGDGKGAQIPPFDITSAFRIPHSTLIPQSAFRIPNFRWPT
jgi:hypothetical protein